MKKTSPVQAGNLAGLEETLTAQAAALDARTWISLEWLPRYAPGLNGIELSWLHLTRHQLAHQTFNDTRAQETTEAVEQAFRARYGDGEIAGSTKGLVIAAGKPDGQSWARNTWKVSRSPKRSLKTEQQSAPKSF